ncbi:PEPxxWA-CTERM sorting domain-containing protein [uncultured Sphingomonas sp.]|uniref:PEPxxWA-CTERM sorting domain-containing protein n=1 Tax=uncultured Sphingomonas sp. TaxID=158754 RepID=UPI0025F56C41|nr:PEPxxWA-CTERM sorting domain-containing protein [uncultured Sphingomonas sp.]
MRGLLLPLAAAWLALPMAAHAAEIITFAPLASAASHSVAGPYVEKGLKFAMSNPFGFFVWGTGSAGNAQPGGATLAPSSYGNLTISTAGGTTFDLVRFDVADVMNFGSGGPIVYSYESLGGSGTGLFNLDITPGLQTVSLNLTDLKRFTIFADPPGVQIDNVTFTLGTSGVPEPASWALLIGGAAMAGAALRRLARPATA